MSVWKHYYYTEGLHNSFDDEQSVDRRFMFSEQIVSLVDDYATTRTVENGLALGQIWIASAFLRQLKPNLNHVWMKVRVATYSQLCCS